MLEFLDLGNLNLAISMLVVMVIRTIAVKKELALPFQPKM